MVIGAWVLLALFIGGAQAAVPGGPETTFTLSGTDSATAMNLAGSAFADGGADLAPIVMQDNSLDFTSPEGTAIIDRTAKALEGMPDDISGVTTPSERASLMSADHHTVMIEVDPTTDALRTVSEANRILTTAQNAAGPGVQVAAAGILGAVLSAPNTHLSEILGILAAIIVLYLVMRRWSAVFLPLVNALVAVGLGLAIITVLGRLVYIPNVAPTLGTMLGLGVGIDYALFLITRHRTLLNQGFDVPDAIGRTAGTAGAGLVFAGCTLIAAVCGLALTGLSFLAWLGFAAAIVVGLAVLSSLTLVPAILGILGRRVIPRKTHAMDHGHHEALDNSRWAKLADMVTGNPWRAAIISVIILFILAAPTVTMKLGVSDAGDAPTSTTSRQSYDMISEGFGPGFNGPLLIVTQLYSPATAPKDVPAGTTDPRTADPRLVKMDKALSTTPGVVETDPPVVSPDGGVAFIRVVPRWAPSNPLTDDLVEHLRSTTLPPLVAGQGMAAHVGGITAATDDLYQLIAERTPWFILGVVTLSFILLMLAYRSLVIPLKAAIMNLISITAAYGVVTVIFQWGWGAKLIGLEGPIPIDSYVPMMMFAVLFGLSMDYEVFLLTSFREHWARTGDMVVSVRRGLADTGKLVTSAASIMVVVFASFILSTTPLVKLFGVGQATAVIVDASIVRCILVPAIMVLAAKGTWWLPGWLDRLLPKLNVEGDPVALDALTEEMRHPKPRHKSLIKARPVAVIGVAAGAGLSWILMSRLPVIPLGATTPIAVAAIVGAVLVLLPSEVAGRTTTVANRVVAYCSGVALAVLVVATIRFFAAPIRLGTGALSAAAVVIVSLILVFAIRRSVALPAILGALVVAVAASVMGMIDNTSVWFLLFTAFVPTLFTVLIASAVVAVANDDRVRQPQLPPPPPTVREPEHVGGPR